MSYYYNYYLGIKSGKDGKIYPLGPFDLHGKYLDVLSRSRSFASDLHNMFYVLPEDMMSDRLKDVFTYETYDGKKELNDTLKYLPIDSLPRGSYIRRAYFLIEDIEAYEKCCSEGGEPVDVGDWFYDYIPTSVYAHKLQNEIALGVPKPKVDEFGGEIHERSCGEYALYAYPDYMSKEYEAFFIREAAYTYEYTTEELKYGADGQIIVLETEG